jgi:ABC-type hemin transport system ATPase subunit
MADPNVARMKRVAKRLYGKALEALECRSNPSRRSVAFLGLDRAASRPGQHVPRVTTTSTTTEQYLFAERAGEVVRQLDVSVQAQVLELLDDIRRRLELAMLFITHDLRVAAQVCDTVAVMHQGRVVEYGPVGEIFAHPKDDYTKSLFAAAPGKDWDFGRFAA